MATKSVLNDSRQVERAVALIQLGARLQVLESETDLSYERLLRLYKEVAGRSPSKGQLPFSTEWFLTWQPNIHASLFQNTYEYLTKVTAMDDIDAIMKAYRLYTEQIAACGVEPLLSMTKCSKCGGHFVSEAYENSRHYECGLCTPPARAGKGAQVGGILLH